MGAEQESISSEALQPTETAVEQMGTVLPPELHSRLSASFAELRSDIEQNVQGSILVFNEQNGEVSQDEATARQIMMAGLGVRDFQVEVYDDPNEPGQKRYIERIITNLPGVEIVYADQVDGGRTISLAVNHDQTDQRRVSPTAIERVLRSGPTHEDWMKSVEQFGVSWRNRAPEVQKARLLALDIDECVFPELGRRTPSFEMEKQLAAELRQLNELGVTLVFNTNRSAIETQRVLEFFEQFGVELNGAITEGGAIRIRRNDDGQWQMERNPTVDEAQWRAIEVCKQHIQEKYIDTSLGHQEPKVSAVTFNFYPGSEVTGHEVIEELRQLLIEQGLPTDSVDRADVSPGGLQLLAGIDKAEGMRYIHQTENLTKEETIAIGDSDGDIPMFTEAALSAAPYNAKLRKEGFLVDYQSPYDAEYGVADILRQIIRLKQSPEIT